MAYSMDLGTIPLRPLPESRGTGIDRPGQRRVVTVESDQHVYFRLGVDDDCNDAADYRAAITDFPSSEWSTY